MTNLVLFIIGNVKKNKKICELHNLSNLMTALMNFVYGGCSASLELFINIYL